MHEHLIHYCDVITFITMVIRVFTDFYLFTCILYIIVTYLGSLAWYSASTTVTLFVWCWLPNGCVDQRSSFLKLHLLSNHRCSQHICGWVKIKQYCR